MSATARSNKDEDCPITPASSQRVEIPAPCSDGDKKAQYLGYTKRPRTPNTQYTVLTDEQIMNIKKDPSPLFMVEAPKSAEEENPNGPPREGGRYYKDRFVNSMSQYNLRGEPLSDPYCYIDGKWSRNVDGMHGSCRIPANPRWGPTRVAIPGTRTLRHLEAEHRNDYVGIDMTRRPPTNQPGEIIFKYGRPNEGYYSERNPSSTTWYGATFKVSDQHAVPSTKVKTMEEYNKINTAIKDSYLSRSGEWPEWSEYTDKYILRNATETGEPLEDHWLTDKPQRTESRQMAEVSC